jgi:hypothetical protein
MTTIIVILINFFCSYSFTVLAIENLFQVPAQKQNHDKSLTASSVLANGLIVTYFSLKLLLNYFRVAIMMMGLLKGSNSVIISINC